MNNEKHPLTTLHPRLLRAFGEDIYDRRMKRLIALSDIIMYLYGLPKGKEFVSENDSNWISDFAHQHGILEETVIAYLKQLAALNIVTLWYKLDNGKKIKAYQLIRFLND